MEKKMFFKPLIWSIVVSLILSMLPLELTTSEVLATEKSTEKSKKDSPVTLLEAPNKFEGLNEKELEEITQSDTIIEQKDNGQYRATFFDDDVQIKSETGISNVDTTLSLEGNTYSTNNAEMEVDFSQTINKNSPYLKILDKDMNTSVVLKGIEYEGGLVAPQTKQAEVKDNVIWYRNIFENIDLRHVALNKEVKEDIVINSKGQAVKSIAYEIKTDKT